MVPTGIQLVLKEAACGLLQHVAYTAESVSGRYEIDAPKGGQVGAYVESDTSDRPDLMLCER